MIERKEQTKSLLMEHYRVYPKLQIRDTFKFLHQSSFGCEHLVTNPETVNDYIIKESEAYSCHRGNLTEPLDGAYCRVHLDWIESGLRPKTLGKLFFLSARTEEDGTAALEEKLCALRELVRDGLLPFQTDEVEREIEEWKHVGYQAYHHSEAFRDCYRPAYRVIRKEYALFLPLLVQIERMSREGRVTLAIEGGSASGKTTLSMLLEELYDTTVFHMDDFFLRPEQRTKERFEQPGQNVDWERFLEEVLVPLDKRECIYYRRFDCSTFTIASPVVKKPSKINTIEGAYSMHPELARYYTFSVFLDVPRNVQEVRIRKRNSPELAERFFKEWIPLEQHYFDQMNVKERCDMVIKIEQD